MTRTTVTEPGREVPVFGDYEVVVARGGPAGIASALSAGEPAAARS